MRSSAPTPTPHHAWRDLAIVDQLISRIVELEAEVNRLQQRLAEAGAPVGCP